MSIPEQLAKAIELHKQGNLEAAEQIYEILLPQGGASAELLYIAGMAAWMLGKTRMAKERLEQALAQDSNDDRYLNLLGNVFQSLQEYEKSIEQYEKALTIEDANVRTWTNMGVAQHELGMLEKARQSHQKALSIDPMDIGALYNAGRTALALKKYLEAETLLRSALEQDAEDSDTLNNLGNALLHQDKIKQARLFYAKAIAANSQNHHALYNLAMSYKKFGEYDEAKKRLQAILSVDPHNFDAIVALADIAIQVEDFYNAEQLYQIALRIQPQNHLCLTGLGFSLFKQEQYQSAIAAIEDGLKQMQDVEKESSAELWISLGIAYRGLYIDTHNPSMLRKAADAFQKAADLEPQNGKARYLMHAAAGTLPPRAPLDYLQNLFNAYAPRFDRHLSDVLNYKTPEKLHHFLQESASGRTYENILDLGCGTGLMAECLQSKGAQCTGVDISSKMLEEARKKNLYETLFAGDILQYLDETDQQYDLVVAADVLVYFGDLSPIFQKISRVLKPKGFFLFSVEKQDTGLSLSLEARFQHSLSHIKQSLPNDMILAHSKEEGLRQNADDWVFGWLCLLQKQ